MAAVSSVTWQILLQWRHVKTLYLRVEKTIYGLKKTIYGLKKTIYGFDLVSAE